LLEALVTMSRLDSGVAFEFHPLDLSGFVRQIYTRSQPRFEANALQAHLDLAEGLPSVRVAQDELYTAYASILDNAIRYTPAGGEITLRTSCLNNEILAEIIDTGIGIEPEELKRIFERFYRVDKARSTRGFGLGLAIAARIIEAHGGMIEVESQVGHGSTFRIRLPLNSPARSNGTA
jgi:two-component system phosphate regulon sensor histidine kinase PhoR